MRGRGGPAHALYPHRIPVAGLSAILWGVEPNIERDSTRTEVLAQRRDGVIILLIDLVHAQLCPLEAWQWDESAGDDEGAGTKEVVTMKVQHT